MRAENLSYWTPGKSPDHSFVNSHLDISNFIKRRAISRTARAACGEVIYRMGISQAKLLRPEPACSCPRWLQPPGGVGPRGLRVPARGFCHLNSHPGALSCPWALVMVVSSFCCRECLLTSLSHLPFPVTSAWGPSGSHSSDSPGSLRLADSSLTCGLRGRRSLFVSGWFIIKS